MAASPEGANEILEPFVMLLLCAAVSFSVRLGNWVGSGNINWVDFGTFCIVEGEVVKKLLIFIFVIALAFFVQGKLFAAETVIVTSYSGDVKVIKPGEAEPISCKADMMLDEGTRIMTGKESFVEIAFDRARKNSVKVAESAEVVIKLDGGSDIQLIDGDMFTTLRELKKESTFKVQAPGCILGARGTGWLTQAMASGTIATVFDGKIFARGVNKDDTLMEEEVWIESGYRI